MLCRALILINGLVSQSHQPLNIRKPAFQEDWHLRPRRLSHDEKNVTAPRRFLIDVEETIRVILEQEDTDGDFQISVTDAGPKMMALGTATSNGYKTFDIRVRSTLWSSLVSSTKYYVLYRAHTCYPTYSKS